jgi:sorbitol-specific phosphotransferase system component IIC
MGGIWLGISFLQQTEPFSASQFPTLKFRPFNLKYGVFFLWPFPLLFFANRLPLSFPLFAVIFLAILWGERKIRTGRFCIPTPLDLPNLSFLICALTSWFSAVNSFQSGSAVCMLIASMVLFYELTNFDFVEKRIDKVIKFYLIIGIFVALSPFFIMPFPEAKLPFVPRLYDFLPNFFPRKIHPNYIGGSLTFFFPVAFWAFALRHKEKVWNGIACGFIGLGLLMTQSRGALLAVGVALALTGAYWSREVRKGLLFLLIAGALALPIAAEVLPDSIELPSKGMLAKRQEQWERGVFIAQDYPFMGIGMRSYPIVVDLLYPLSLSGPDARIPHAHNLYIEVAASTGFPGFVAFWAMLGVWGMMVWELLKEARRGGKRGRYEVFGVGLAGGMIAHLLYSITDVIAIGEKAGIFFWISLGLTTVLWRRVQRENTEKKLRLREGKKQTSH